MRGILVRGTRVNEKKPRKIKLKTKGKKKPATTKIPQKPQVRYNTYNFSNVLNSVLPPIPEKRAAEKDTEAASKKTRKKPKSKNETSGEKK